ncbi:hypothetical protein H072_8777 [Dactylellina haptotyla CBS 200.50]|uniref:Aminoglycoside phosphotransferase domain-containing protein n=1 Tax=Dactylellina haptotyla (strain CBS 200.50) TaxID=1284197 RepID=S8A427_DACHA|nr:hypothetical protein H072_8777 [Dactylellina haptotyla CBS 200.50]
MSDEQEYIASSGEIQLVSSLLPSSDSETFYQSSYFSGNSSRDFPSPEQIRDLYFKKYAKEPNLTVHRPPPSIFPEQNLLVKWGTVITIAEGQCLYILREKLASNINVPEIYGWRRENGVTYIYMELVNGKQLDKVWDTLCESERESNIARGPLKDIMFSSPYNPPAGPFATVRDFHDWFTQLSNPPEARDYTPDPLRAHLIDNSDIVFTHGDLHPSNILVSLEEEKDGTQRFVLTIIDWHQSGWLPAYWEGCKARWTAEVGGPWAQIYLPKFLEMLGPEPVFKVYDGDVDGTRYDAWNCLGVWGIAVLSTTE